jgi:hypothetical protein
LLSLIFSLVVINARVRPLDIQGLGNAADAVKIPRASKGERNRISGYPEDLGGAADTVKIPRAPKGERDRISGYPDGLGCAADAVKMPQSGGKNTAHTPEGIRACP